MLFVVFVHSADGARRIVMIPADRVVVSHNLKDGNVAVEDGDSLYWADTAEMSIYYGTYIDCIAKANAYATESGHTGVLHHR